MTNDEIRRKIAKLQGWTRVVSRHGFITGIPLTDKDSLNDVPDWPVNIAYAWLLAIEAGLSVMKTDKGYIAGVFDLDWEYLDPEDGVIDGHLSDGYAEANTAPLAICLAYIQWKESQSG